MGKIRNVLKFLAGKSEPLRKLRRKRKFIIMNLASSSASGWGPGASLRHRKEPWDSIKREKFI
jgi:hypothetical protein